MQTTDQRPAIVLCLLLSMFAMYAGFVCIRIAAGHDVRPDLAVWAILAACVLLGASAARNTALRARASRARESGGLGASAYGRLDLLEIDLAGVDLAGVDQVLHKDLAYFDHANHLRRAGEARPDTWTSEGRDAALQASDRQLILSAIHVAGGLSYNDEHQAPAKHLLRELAHRFGAAIGFDGRATPAQVDEAVQHAAGLATASAEMFEVPEFVEVEAGDDEASIVHPCNGDELLCEMMQELDDMLGESAATLFVYAPDTWRAIGRTWRDICIALDIEQPTYMHQAPEHWGTQAYSDNDSEQLGPWS